MKQQNKTNPHAIREQLVCQELLQLGVSGDVAKKDSKILVRAAEHELEQIRAQMPLDAKQETFAEPEIAKEKHIQNSKNYKK